MSSAKPGPYDATMIPYATFTLTLSWEDADNNPISSTGLKCLWQVRQSFDEDTVLAEATNQSGTLFTLGGLTLPNIIMKLPPSITKDVPIGTWEHALFIKKTNGDVDCLLKGSLIVAPATVRKLIDW